MSEQMEPYNPAQKTRIHTSQKKQASTTEAWANQAHMTQDANVSIPSDEAILEAKDWVDNGSKL